MPNKNKIAGPQNLDGMLKKIPRNSDIELLIEKSSEEAKNGEFAPFIFYFENENGIPMKVFVVTNDLTHETSAFTTAADALVKSYFVFHLSYPRKAINVLTFVQQFFYQIFLEYDIRYTTILSVMYDVDLERATECEKLMAEKLN